MFTLIAAFDALDRFENFSDGWNFGEGLRANPISLHYCRELLRFAFDLGHREAEVFPGVGGEVQVCFFDDDDVLEITAEANGSLTLVVEQNDAIIYRRTNANFIETLKILKDFTFNQCRSYVSSISKNITAAERKDYQVWHSDRHQTAVSRLSIGTVFTKKEQAFASISPDFIRSESPAIRLLFGKFQTI